jgi:fatty-acyl-CoA synthase/long-chain acyl-CoA synthetase
MIISRKELIARAARLFQDKPAFVYEGQSLGFRDVNDRANRLANALGDHGLKPRDRVATLMRNCLQYPEIEFALVKGCFPQIPLNPRLTAAEQRFQLNESEARAIIVQYKYLDLIKPIRKELNTLKLFVCFGGEDPEMLSYDELLSSSSAREPEGELEHEDIGEIRYTSGTTGTPKGILLPYWSRLAITRNFLMEHLGDLTPEDSFLALQPLYHGAGWFMLPVWMRGATQYIVPRYDAETAFDAIEKNHITVVKTIPTVLLRLINHAEIKRRNLGTVRHIIYGGSPMPVEKLKEAKSILGPIFTNLYGQMEAPMTIAWLRKEENTGQRMTSVGRPCAFVQVKIVDNDGNEKHPSEIGEVVVRGDHQMIGYLNRADATNETIRNGWIYTGDLGTVDEHGYVYLTG